ncbi:hypothetical protein AMTR_s00089p00087180 [Amborella trichopoda]|uniref:Uncharacterized protein n=1 Tax=Amborella trichopoda TaxID=13333 RepID=W1P2H5_AMBTC|nr:hypothetical protein AMTR_s00089p00087180 [Amborella trichopoda]
MTSLVLPRYLSISLSLKFTATIQRGEGHAINIPLTITQDESSRKCLVSFNILGLASSSDEGIPEIEVHEGALVADSMKDAKSREIAHLRDLVTRLCSEVEHHQNTSNFYRGEVEHAMETSPLLRGSWLGSQD